MAEREMADPFAESDPFDDEEFDDEFGDVTDDSGGLEFVHVGESEQLESGELRAEESARPVGGTRNADLFGANPNMIGGGALSNFQLVGGKKEKKFLKYNKKGFWERVTLTCGYGYLIGERRLCFVLALTWIVMFHLPCSP